MKVVPVFGGIWSHKNVLHQTASKLGGVKIVSIVSSDVNFFFWIYSRQFTLFNTIDNSKIYIQLTHISPLVQFATAVEYFVHLMKHLCCLNADNDKDIPFVNTRARLTMQILAREARQMVKHEDWTINKRDDEMKQRVKDATAHLMHRIKDFGCNSPDRQDDEIDELTPFAMVKKKNDEEVWYNGEMVVKVLWKNIEDVNSQ